MCSDPSYNNVAYVKHSQTGLGFSLHVQLGLDISSASICGRVSKVNLTETT